MVIYLQSTGGTGDKVGGTCFVLSIDKEYCIYCICDNLGIVSPFCLKFSLMLIFFYVGVRYTARATKQPVAESDQSFVATTATTINTTTAPAAS